MNKYLKITMNKAGLDFTELFVPNEPNKDSYEDEASYWEDRRLFVESKGINQKIIKDDVVNRAYSIPIIYSHQTDDFYFSIPVLEGAEPLQTIVSAHPDFVSAELIDEEEAITLFNDWVFVWYHTQPE